jgi:two-component system alkaline phosphatase synthesis response regulator PhoP
VVLVRFTVLVAEDDPYVAELVKYNLERENYRVLLANDGPSAWRLAVETLPDLLVLDLMLPGMDGYELCRRLRKDPRTETLPIIMLTCRSDEADKVLGFELGADDYITKPFAPRELVARVRARLRLPVPLADTGGELRYGDLVIRPVRYQVLVRGKEVRLTAKEFDLLHFLASHPNRVFSRSQLLSAVWDIHEGCCTRTVDVHIRYLRRKIETDPDRPRYIETIRGVGYRFSAKGSSPEAPNLAEARGGEMGNRGVPRPAEDGPSLDV